MNIDVGLPISERLLPTGYTHIDEPREATASGIKSLMTFKPLPDPVGIKLSSSRRATAVQAGQPIDAETDFLTAASAYWVDSYVRRAVDEYVNLVLKGDYAIKGRNPQAVEYIRLRLRTLKKSCGNSFNQIVHMLAYCVVLFGNAFLVKAPFKGKTPIPGLTLKPGPGVKPVGGLFWVHPALMKAQVNDKGEITEWIYTVDGQERARFKPADIIHVTYSKPPNILYGQPFFLPVLEDIRTLRQLEYQTIMLVNRYLHPIIHVRKGITKDGRLVGKIDPDDIADLEDLIRSMSADGTLITAADVVLDVHGMDGQTLDVSPILSYWKKRGFGGLGLSALIMGEGVAGVATADSLTAEMHDMAQAFQRVIALAINDEVLFDMLLEGGFDPITNEDEAHFEFSPIAVDEAIKVRNQTIQEWFAGEMSHDEFRRRMGDDPMSDGDLEKTWLGLQKRFGATPANNPTQAVVDNKQRPAGKAGKKSSPKGKVVTPAKKPAKPTKK